MNERQQGMKKITLLLGAGFAQHLEGKGTADINKEFERYDQYMVGDRSLYIHIASLLNEVYNDFNFETFLAIIENVADFRLSEFRDGVTSTSWKSITSTIYDLRDFLEECECLKDQMAAFEVLRDYINLLIRVICEYDTLNDPECSARAQKGISFYKYIDRLKEHYSHIKIYSTNYDSLIPQIFKKEIYLGGDRNGDMEEFTFSYDIEKFRESKLTYFPIHGCVCFCQRSLGEIRVLSAPQEMPLYSQSNHGGNPNRETIFMPIISGYNKLEHINGEPFNYGFHAFATDCFDSEKIITMGYSWRDPHINSVIETFSLCPIKSITRNDPPIIPMKLHKREISLDTGGIEAYINSYL